jgi:signal transduction histidine kinase
MKPMRMELAARYLATLRRHIDRRGHDNHRLAQSLGRVALAKGLAAGELAAIHEKAVLTLARSRNFADASNRTAKRAELFFNEALLPLEEAARATQQKNEYLTHRNQTLRAHTATVDRSNRRLAREMARRKAGEVKLAEAMDRYRGLFLASQIMQDKLRQLTRQILVAQEEERKKISRELHDEVVQTLVGINVALSALGRTTSVGPQTLKQKIARTQRLVEKAVRAVHRFARELRPAVLDDLGLVPALQAYSKAMAARTGIRVQITASREIEALSSARRAVLFRVAQEALNNVARHARATQVALEVRQQDGTVEMQVSDNGKSFHVGKTLSAKNNRRLGLIGMKERIEMIGGTLQIESSPGIGTTVRTRIPFEPENSLP